MTRPNRSYIVAASPRSGSTMLCRALGDTGIAGRPEEYFLTGPPEAFPPGWRFWEDGIIAAPFGSMTRVEYVELVHRLGTTDNGVFGAKVMWNYVPWMLERVEEMPEHAGTTAVDKLRMLFPGLDRIVVLTRRDKVRQAVSWLRASQDGVWVVSDDEPARPAGAPRYDAETISAMIGLLDAADRGWLGFAADLDLEPLCVTYEDLVARDRYDDVVRGVLRGLRLPADQVSVPGPRTHRQSDALNDVWADRYRRERDNPV